MSKSSKVSEIILSNILKKCQYLAGEMKFICIISLRDGIMGPTLPLSQPHLFKSLNNRDAQDLTHQLYWGWRLYMPAALRLTQTLGLKVLNIVNT